MRLKSALLVVALATLPISINACGGPAALNVLQFAPERDFSFMFVAKPKELIESGLFKRIIEEIKEAAADYEKMKEGAEELGIDLEELQYFAGIASPDNGEGLAFLVGGSIDIEKYKDHLEKTEDVEFEEEKEGDITYWTDNENNYLLETAGGLAIISNEDILKDAIDVITKGENRLAGDDDFSNALSLADANATISAFIWEGIDIEASSVAPLFGTVEEDEAVVNEVSESMEDVEAAGFSLYVTDGIEVRAKVRFKKPESAQQVGNFLDEKKTGIFKQASKQAQFAALVFNTEFDPEDIEDLANDLTVSSSGNILDLHLKIEDVSWIIESVSKSMNTVRQRATVSNIMALGRSVEMYIMDFPHIGAPKAADINELMDILESVELAVGSEIVKDGWGYLLEYSADPTPGARNYTIMSYGSDGALGPEVAPDENGERFVTRPEEDIIWSNGWLYQRPSGSPTLRY